jgi:hypothetical protein
MRSALTTSIVAVMACVTRCASAQSAATTTQIIRTEQRLSTYAYAHEFGSGVYDLSGRTLQVYRLPLARTLREPSKSQSGIRLTLPVTLGFLDFNPREILGAQLPHHIDSLSFVPGIEWEFRHGDNWRLYPYFEAGGSFANGATLDSTLYGTGVRAEYRRRMGRWKTVWRNDLIYSGVNFRGDLPSDHIVRWRQGVDGLRATGFEWHGFVLQAGAFAVLDVYPQASRGALLGTQLPVVNLEVGLTFDWAPQPRLWRIGWPRLGISYREAGVVSGWRLVLGAPF